jgi:hypothetical protein
MSPYRDNGVRLQEFLDLTAKLNTHDVTMLSKVAKELVELRRNIINELAQKEMIPPPKINIKGAMLGSGKIPKRPPHPVGPISPKK